MHEGAVTRNIMDLVLRTLEQKGIDAPVTAVNVLVGVSQGLVPDSMRMFFDMEKPGTPLAGAELNVQLQPLTARCPACDKEIEIDAPVMICRRCGGPMDLIRGAELVVSSIEVEQ